MNLTEPVERNFFEKLIVFWFLYKKKVSCCLQKRSLRDSFLSNINLHSIHFPFIQIRFNLAKDLRHSQRGNEVKCRTLSPDPSWIHGLTYYAVRLHYIHLLLPMPTQLFKVICSVQTLVLKYFVNFKIPI